MPKSLDNILPGLYTGDDIELGNIVAPEGQDDRVLKENGVVSFGHPAKPGETIKVRCQKCDTTWIADICLFPGSAIRVRCRKCNQFVTFAVPQEVSHV